jgi:hypothetical protein
MYRGICGVTMAAGAMAVFIMALAILAIWQAL